MGFPKDIPRIYQRISHGFPGWISWIDFLDFLDGFHGPKVPIIIRVRGVVPRTAYCCCRVCEGGPDRKKKMFVSVSVSVVSVVVSVVAAAGLAGELGFGLALAWLGL